MPRYRHFEELFVITAEALLASHTIQCYNREEWLTNNFCGQKFDFYFYIDKERFLAIEIDESHHFHAYDKPCKRPPEEIQQDFQRVQYRDHQKNIWCRDKNIPLLRIAYSVDQTTAFIQKVQEASPSTFIFEFIGKEYANPPDTLFEPLPQPPPRPREQKEEEQIPTPPAPTIPFTLTKAYEKLQNRRRRKRNLPPPTERSNPDASSSNSKE